VSKDGAPEAELTSALVEVSGVFHGVAALLPIKVTLPLCSIKCNAMKTGKVEVWLYALLASGMAASPRGKEPPYPQYSLNKRQTTADMDGRRRENRVHE
jgi:hypothetical protein